MELKRDSSYTVFLELVHGCVNHTCSTRLGCNAYPQSQREMTLDLANAVIADLVHSAEMINRIILFGRGDSTSYSLAPRLSFHEKFDLFSNSFVFPYEDAYSIRIWRLYRVDSVRHVKALIAKPRSISKVFTVVDRANLDEMEEMIQLLLAFRHKNEMKFDIHLNHHDARYDYSPRERDTLGYVAIETIMKYLKHRGILYTEIAESEVTSFRDCRAFIIDAWGKVVPCFYLDRPFFDYRGFNDTVRQLSGLVRPCDTCLENQSPKWRVSIDEGL